MNYFQLLDELLKIERGISERNIEKIETKDHCIHGDAHVKYNHSRYQNSRHNSCAILSLDEIFVMNSGGNGVPSTTCNRSSNNETEVVLISNDHVQGEPILRKFDLGASSSPTVNVNSKEFTAAEISVIILFLTCAAFIIACTICDTLRRTSKGSYYSPTIDTLSKFSLYTNAHVILSTKVTPQMMPAIHGIRVLSCILIVSGHRYITSTVVFGQKATILGLIEGKMSPLSFIVLMETYIVDSFLLMSGFLTAHLFFKMMRSGKKVSWSTICILRYFRITPCLALIILFATFLFPRTGSGPLWEMLMTRTVDHCRESWWTYLFHVQNLIKDGNLCFPHGWYLALDMQLFWLSAIVLYPLYYWPKFGLRVLSALLVVSVVIPVMILASNGYSNANLRFDRKLTRLVENFENYYIPTYNRACPYLVGIFLGYDIATKKRHLSQLTVAISWVVTSVLLLFCTWFTNIIYNSNFAYDLYMEIASTALVRPFWSIAIAWIIYACTQGYGGLAARFLSLPIFFPLSRLTYGIFLFHAGFQSVTLTSLQTPPKYLGFEMVFGICGDLVGSIVAAFLFSLFIESPIIALVNILTRRNLERTVSVDQHQKNEKMAIENCKTK